MIISAGSCRLYIEISHSPKFRPRVLRNAHIKGLTVLTVYIMAGVFLKSIWYKLLKKSRRDDIIIEKPIQNNTNLKEVT